MPYTKGRNQSGGILGLEEKGRENRVAGLTLLPQLKAHKPGNVTASSDREFAVGPERAAYVLEDAAFADKVVVGFSDRSL